jgi:hypothetical protein
MTVATTAREASRRRVTVLAILSSIVLVALGLMLLGSMSMGVVVVAALPLIGYVVAVAATASQRHRAPAPRRTRTLAEPVVAEPRAPRATRAARPRGMSLQEELEEFAQWDPWEEESGDSWQAEPTMLPTYVSAPRASQVPREIDRASGGDWGGEAMVSAARRMRRPRITVDDLTDERYGVMPSRDVDATAEIPAVRRAVNE